MYGVKLEEGRSKSGALGTSKEVKLMVENCAGVPAPFLAVLFGFYFGPLERVEVKNIQFLY